MSTISSVSELLLRPTVFTRPLRLVEPTSWVPHIPFAFWLIDALRPRTVVELGTHSGNSFCAFAQAVQILGLETACYAVDTWTGDPHTSPYGDEVFQELSTFHNPHFGTFSRLVRSTFDDALTKFEDGTIDLLHIDGYHTHEAVRHDFESWFPKLSANAVVLLHDTNVREMDFGVWKFWQDLSRDYPCFAFLHGHGLGVVGVGRGLPPDVRLLVEHPHQSQNAFTIRQFFGTLGEALLRQPREATQARIETELRSELSKIWEALTSEREQFAGWLAERDQALDGARAELSRITKVLTSEREQFAGWLAERDQALDGARAELSKITEVLTSEREQFAGWLAERDQALDGTRAELGKITDVLTSERERFTGWLAERDRALEAARIEISELSGANEEIGRVLAETTQAREDSRSHAALESQQLQERLELHEATIKAQEAELTRLSAERGRLEGALQSREEELRLERQQLQGREEELRLERQQLQGRVKWPAATIRSQGAELARLGAERRRLERALQSREKELHEVRSGLDRYRAAVTRLEQDAAKWFRNRDRDSGHPGRIGPPKH